MRTLKRQIQQRLHDRVAGLVLGGVLLKERLDLGPHRHRLVELGVGAALVGAEIDQIELPRAGRDPLAQLPGGVGVVGVHQLAGEAREGGEHVDCGVVTALCEPGREAEMAVQEAAHLVADGVVLHIAPFGEHE